MDTYALKRTVGGNSAGTRVVKTKEGWTTTNGQLLDPQPAKEDIVKLRPRTR